MDIYHVGFNCELLYENHALLHSYNVQFSHLSYDNSHIRYCDSCHNSQNLFGCVGVKQGSYVIFNKKYSEEEYQSLCDRIIAHMKTTGEYGEFYPPTLSPFGYNETIGDIYVPISKEYALKNGWNWEDNTPGTRNRETISLKEMPDDIGSVQDDILENILICGICKNNFNIVKPELDFYRRENIPLPRECPNCRHSRRVYLRLPRKLFHRRCMCRKDTHDHIKECPVEFETPYAPDRPEIIYCESCYNSEVV